MYGGIGTWGVNHLLEYHLLYKFLLLLDRDGKHMQNRYFRPITDSWDRQLIFIAQTLWQVQMYGGIGTWGANHLLEYHLLYKFLLLMDTDGKHMQNRYFRPSTDSWDRQFTWTT